MAAGAEAAAVRATSQQVKRRLEEEDSEETSVQTTKQIKPDQGLNSMAHAFASLTLHASSEETKKTRDDSPAPGNSKKDVIVEVPYNQIVIQEGGIMPVQGSKEAAGFDCYAK